MAEQLFSIVQKNPIFLAFVVFSGIATFLLPSPLGDSNLFTVFLAVLSGLSGMIIGKPLSYLNLTKTVASVIILIVLSVSATVGYLKMINSITTPSWEQILLQSLLYVIALSTLFALARIADFKMQT